jgi:hypothetical protein
MQIHRFVKPDEEVVVYSLMLDEVCPQDQVEVENVNLGIVELVTVS